MVNKILLVFKSSPQEEGVAEGFRVATAMIAMDVLPRLLFVDDGVFWLIKEKLDQLENSSVKERLQTISDLVGLQVLSDSMAQKKLKSGDLDEGLDAKVLSLDEAAELIMQNHAVIAF
jgi:sulfur relay (sulfurtransferase) DsrF/TusC family protein